MTLPFFLMQLRFVNFNALFDGVLTSSDRIGGPDHRQALFKDSCPGSLNGIQLYELPW